MTENLPCGFVHDGWRHLHFALGIGAKHRPIADQVDDSWYPVTQFKDLIDGPLGEEVSFGTGDAQPMSDIGRQLPLCLKHPNGISP